MYFLIADILDSRVAIGRYKADVIVIQYVMHIMNNACITSAANLHLFYIFRNNYLENISICKHLFA